ncbi:MAG: ribosome hibernation-promoting factor, HPF/YfiA family [Dehalococcoidia bacterium]
MEVTFRGRHMEVPSQVQELYRRKLLRLERHLPAAAEAAVEVRREGVKAASERYSVQITIDCYGTYLRAEERAQNIYGALDAALDALSRQAERYKEKLYRRRRRLAAAAKATETSTTSPASEETGEETPLAKIARVKSFPVKPMAAEEAIEQMELLGHNFFLFFDTDAQQYALLYRRHQGDYGLILPEPA